MSGKYDKIMHLSRPRYDDFPPMPINERAAQFSALELLSDGEDFIAERLEAESDDKEQSRKKD